jgi:signal transduction histidine kinase
LRAIAIDGWIFRALDKRPPQTCKYPPQGIIPNRPEHAAAIAHNIAGTAALKPYKWEGRWLKDGKVVWVSIESVPRKIPGLGVVWEGAFIDITARKEAEAQLLAAKEEARERERRDRGNAASQTHAQFEDQPTAAAVAHEINQPLSTILLESNMAMAGAVDARGALAITNILRNAAEAIDESAADRREISVRLAQRKGQVEISIGDSVPGWSGAEQMDTPLTTTKKGGTGIGLYVVRTAMENHRGEIRFGTSVLGGAEVKMIFPRAMVGGAAI